MTQKNIVLGICVVLAVVVAGYFFFGNSIAGFIAEDSTAVPATGKLDIRAVCESDLAYTTFTDAASAEAFVEACVQGEHPDVIERYKEQMGLGDGAAI